MQKTTFDCISFIKTLTSFGERQYQGEIKTADFLEQFLTGYHCLYTIQKFKTTVPREKRALLKADGESIPCKSVCLYSGEITDKATICSSTSKIPSLEKISTPVITFNPYCEAISRNLFFINAPAVSIRYKDVGKILSAKKIEGSVVIEPATYIARNILIGNTINPEMICFAHYDCWDTGAWDNGGGVATIIGTVMRYPQFLKNTLFVLWANEEISYDKYPAYRCKGARAFEKKYLHLLQGAKKIIIIDGIGYAPSQRLHQCEKLTSTFWIKNLKKLAYKMRGLGSRTPFDITFYHSELDTIDKIKKKYIMQTIKIVKEEIETLIT